MVGHLFTLQWLTHGKTSVEYLKDKISTVAILLVVDTIHIDIIDKYSRTPLRERLI